MLYFLEKPNVTNFVFSFFSFTYCANSSSSSCPNDVTKLNKGAEFIAHKENESATKTPNVQILLFDFKNTNPKIGNMTNKTAKGKPTFILPDK